jgi:hypothetical protein
MQAGLRGQRGSDAGARSVRQSRKNLSGALLESTGLCVAVGSIVSGHSVLARARACAICAQTRPVLLSAAFDHHLVVGAKCFDH